MRVSDLQVDSVQSVFLKTTLPQFGVLQYDACGIELLAVEEAPGVDNLWASRHFDIKDHGARPQDESAGDVSHAMRGSALCPNAIGRRFDSDNDSDSATTIATARQRQTAREGVLHTYMSACHGKLVTDLFQQRFRLRQRKRGNECVCVCEMKLKVSCRGRRHLDDGDEGISDATVVGCCHLEGRKLTQAGGMSTSGCVESQQQKPLTDNKQAHKVVASRAQHRRRLMPLNDESAFPFHTVRTPILDLQPPLLCHLVGLETPWFALVTVQPHHVSEKAADADTLINLLTPSYIYLACLHTKDFYQERIASNLFSSQFRTVTLSHSLTRTHSLDHTMASFANSRVCDTQGGLVFFKFPNELRNLIYKYYLQLDEGYKLNPHTNKLRAGNDNPISLDLLYTCKRAALEMQGLPFQHNTITFSAFHPRSRTDGINVGRFHHMMDMMDEELAATFQQLPPRYFHSQVVKEVAAAYPAFIPVLDVMKTDHGDLGNFQSSYGETPSSCRDFIRFTLNSISSNKSLFSDYDRIINEVHYNDEYYGNESPIEQPTVPPDRLFEFAPDPWAIPSQNVLDHFSYLLDPENCRLSCVSDDLYQDEETSVDPQRFRYSAVAAAVRFLDSISPILRGCIRNIRLMEDHMSVCKPQCHGLGMIRFCRENPNLRIERHVKLWDTVFQENLLHLKPEKARQPPRKVLADEISYLIAVWVTMLVNTVLKIDVTSSRAFRRR
ncbi:hypothetical protein CFIO01_03907 [Colletotrichum fioriniae PJ7]|uniref:Uncharacterized protein n=1 Tax=Colletotrichum fioriniae PJ7 TaxID=1445577 RepID=A0A010S011_9PEZI|nr:hypothetical protein CFIO01_03907 [Colletotrichum fioriniae PJ7]